MRTITSSPSFASVVSTEGSIVNTPGRDASQVVERLERGTADLIPREELVAKLERASGSRPLRVKLGIDPSAPHVTLGHSVPLRKMRQFQDLGHTGVLIVGDFTRRIGDPSGQSSTRPLMSEEEITRNLETYEPQLFKILDPERTEIRRNSEWLSALRLDEVIDLAAKYTVARMLERDDFAKRYASGQPISVLEFLYPLVQAYDSVAIEADVELGGSDQLFNLLIARDIQREYGQEPQVVMTLPLLIGTDGVRSMSQTVGNYVGVSEAPGEMYGKLLAIPDELIVPYFEQLTDADREAWGELPPRDQKHRLAWEIVSMYHGEAEADAARAEFERIHVRRERPSEVEQRTIDRALVKDDGTIWILDLLDASGLVSSRGEAKRLLAQGGVRINDERIPSPDVDVPFDPPLLVQVGKRSFVELV
ncbi:MAG: tyrosine--tRNA ligase [Candidatus Bipolaricaulota bacterium]|nr:MAG: tyrosine--tRNA ligase [Candidatus Bipolaricaulota bacterium]